METIQENGLLKSQQRTSDRAWEKIKKAQIEKIKKQNESEKRVSEQAKK